MVFEKCSKTGTMGLKSMKIYFGAGKRSNSYTTNIILNATIFQKLRQTILEPLSYSKNEHSLRPDRNSDRTGTGSPDWDHFGRNRTRTGPDITSQKKLPNSTGLARSTGLAGFLPDFLNFNTQLTSHKNKYGRFNFDI